MRLDIDNNITAIVLMSRDVNLKRYNDAPIDVCSQCYARDGFTDDVDHPPYSDDVYKCAVCGAQLVEWVDD